MRRLYFAVDRLASATSGEKKDRHRMSGVEIRQKKRDIAIDFLRCLLMFFIVLHHAACHGYYKGDTVNWALPILFTTLVFWHVDGFIAISGWFGVRFSLVRFFSLFGVIAFWSIAKLITVGLFGQTTISNLGWSGGWFGGTYLAFLFVAPILNAAVERLASLDKSRFYIIWGVFNVGMMLNWAPYHFFSGVSAAGGGGFSILMFIYVYLNVRFIRALALDSSFSRKTFVACIAIFILGVICFSFPFAARAYMRKGFINHLDWIGYTSYDSPHSLIMAIGALLFFHKFVHVPEAVGRIVSKISPLMFGIYIIHEGTGIGRQLYTIPERWLANHTNLSPLIIVFVCAIATYVICMLLDEIRRIVVLPFKRIAIARLKKLDESLGL